MSNRLWKEKKKLAVSYVVHEKDKQVIVVIKSKPHLSVSVSSK